MQNTSWIKLHRSLLEWEWYDDIHTKTLFLHLLLTANYENKNWRGIIIERGQLVFGRIELSKKLGFSEQTLRTCLTKLKSTNEITIKSTSKYSLLTIVNYNKFQDSEQLLISKSTSKSTNEQPTTNQQLTTTKEYNNIRNKEDSILEPIGEVITSPQGHNSKVDEDKPVKEKKSKTKFIPPSYEEVLVYAKEKNREDIAQKFYDYFTVGNWVDSKGNKVNSWKQKFLTWIDKSPIVKPKEQMSAATKAFLDKYKKGE